MYDNHTSKKTIAYHYDNSNHVSSATIDPDRSPYQYYSAVEQERRYKNSTAYKQAQIQEKRYKNSTAYKIAEHKEKQKQKIIDLKKQRENDRNRTSNFDPDQDPDDDDDDEIIEEIVDVIIDATVDTITDKIEDVSKFIYEGNPKHHLNSQGNRSKPPHDGPNSLKKSVWVKTNSNGLSQRVGIENGNIVIFKEHAPNKYHGYIETNFDCNNNSNRYKDHRKTLIKADLIHKGPTLRIKKR